MSSFLISHAIIDHRGIFSSFFSSSVRGSQSEMFSLQTLHAARSSQAAPCLVVEGCGSTGDWNSIEAAAVGMIQLCWDTPQIQAARRRFGAVVLK